MVHILTPDGWTAEQKQAIAHEITDVIAEVAGMSPEWLWVSFTDVKPADWFEAGRPSRS